MLTEELLDLVRHTTRQKAETQTLEVKAAHVDCPRRLYDTLSSFSNQDSGGILLFGLDETQDFQVVGVYDLQDLQKKCGTDYYSHYLEEVKNKYGKITEYRIIEVRGKVRLSNKINLVFVNKKGKYSGTDSIRYPFKIIHNEFGLNNCRFYDLRGTYATKIFQ